MNPLPPFRAPGRATGFKVPKSVTPSMGVVRNPLPSVPQPQVMSAEDLTRREKKKQRAFTAPTITTTGTMAPRAGGGTPEPVELSAHATVDIPTAPLSVINVQKLNLSPSSPTDGTTIVAVSNGFSVSGSTTTEVNNFYFPNGTNSGKPQFYRPGAGVSCQWDGSNWLIFDDSASVVHGATENVDFPWQVSTWYDIDGVTPSNPQPVLTHPAIQRLVAPDSSQGGVAVIGGTQQGLMVKQASLHEGRAWFVLLGQTIGDPGDGYSAFWDSTQWNINDSGGNALYYSTDDVATPDLAAWLNVADDTPATITVTSVSLGELYAGLFVANDGVTNGSSYVSQPFHGRQYYMGLGGGGSNNMHWDSDFNVWTDDVGVWTSSNVAFPWQGTDSHTGHDGAVFSRNDVANERSWEVVP